MESRWATKFAHALCLGLGLPELATFHFAVLLFATVDVAVAELSPQPTLTCYH